MVEETAAPFQRAVAAALRRLAVALGVVQQGHELGVVKALGIDEFMARQGTHDLRKVRSQPGGVAREQFADAGKLGEIVRHHLIEEQQIGFELQGRNLARVVGVGGRSCAREPVHRREMVLKRVVASGVSIAAEKNGQVLLAGFLPLGVYRLAKRLEMCLHAVCIGDDRQMALVEHEPNVRFTETRLPAFQYWQTPFVGGLDGLQGAVCVHVQFVDDHVAHGVHPRNAHDRVDDVGETDRRAQRRVLQFFVGDGR